MNVTDYTYLINKPDAIHEKQTEALEKVLVEFPYFQSARAIQLKGLYNQNSFKYNTALKITAAHSTDRSILFDFITSDTFTSIQKGLYDKKALEILEIKVVDSEIIVTEEKSESKINSLERSILTSIKEASTIEVDDASKTPEEKLAIGKPLDFSKSEQHSFQEWLQLSRTEPIERAKESPINPPLPVIDEDKRKKLELIDKFIEASPKISPVKHGVASTVTFDLNAADNSFLMTETLARVYLEQKKYQKAIQAYEILILKYPEKSSFFADRISDIKILQHNNN
ncbi:tetratricopeptide repeat protein [Flavobacterium sp. LB2P84]|uniref:Tetratricopeptide repeat protein n=1 Tax=Flavobacterium yafengii TaxID=3041253 RepID=A0AAW6TKQ7_9FLAO|nr:tetratricopeptide repeat protein [Flavobacterium yafengii]MDI5949029.1 tetratricopeptide repeat protein [Flavobacterium yafengii]MDI6031926.1 tetratricopeptide repeat protein [Flavobacterium yafengii]